jgi:hypothetical protein
MMFGLDRLVEPLSLLSHHSVDKVRAICGFLLNGHWMLAWVTTRNKNLANMTILLVVILGGIILGMLLLSPLKEPLVSVVAILVYLMVILANPLRGLLLWIATYPFAELSINIPLGEGIPDLSLTRFCVAFLAVMLLARAAIGERRFPKVSKLDLAALSFFIGVSISVRSSADPLMSFQSIFDLYLIAIVGYFLVKNLVITRQDVEKVITVFLIIGVYAGIYAIYEQFTGNILFTPKEYEIERTLYSENIRILRGLLGGPHVFGSIFAMALPMGFCRFLELPKSAKKNWYAVVVGLMLVGMFLTYKRAAWISMMISFLIMQAFYPKFRRVFWALVIVFALVLVATWEQVGQSELMTERVSKEWETGHGRTDLAEVGIELWKQSPIFGHGFDQFASLSGSNAVENFYLHILVSAGLVGLLPFLAFSILVVRDSILVYRQADGNTRLFLDRKLVIVFWAAVSTFFIKSFTGNQEAAFVQYLFYILIGAMVGSQGELINRKKSTAGVPCLVFSNPPVVNEVE